MTERKLTPAEEKRKKRFDDTCAELYQRDYDQNYVNTITTGSV